MAGLLALLAAVTASAATPTAPQGTEVPPSVEHVSPLVVKPDGRPIRVTLTGTHLSSVTQAFTRPATASQDVTVISDSALVITLPANLGPGTYAITVLGPQGASDPATSTITVMPAAVAAPSGATPPRRSDPLPAAPVAVETPLPTLVAGAVAAVRPGSVLVAQETTRTPFWTPYTGIAAGIALGALLYMLWGKEGRIPFARRRGLVAQVWARPVQALHLGRICIHCGRLHSIFRTPRDLWRAGVVCSPACLLASQDEEMTLARSEAVAPSRMRQVTVYAELEERLEAALRAEARLLGRSLFVDLQGHGPTHPLYAAVPRVEAPHGEAAPA